MIKNKSHLYSLIKYGVYFGYSKDSIIEFVNNFGNAYEIIDGVLYDYRTKGPTQKTGHMCSWYEAITLSRKEIIDNINSKRYYHIPFPLTDKAAFDKSSIENAIANLYRNDFHYRRNVEQLVNYIELNLDITFEE